MGYEDDGTVFPEYDVQFTDSDIIYGHMKDGIFTQDHADKIISLEATATGGFKVQAKAANGIEYTYRTCENDKDVLEYYETWMEEDFPEMYRGGASLSKKVESDEKSFEY
jgi:pyruvate dehydrogenase complex dehydrogenase (E1) component